MASFITLPTRIGNRTGCASSRKWIHVHQRSRIHEIHPRMIAHMTTLLIRFRRSWCTSGLKMQVYKNHLSSIRKRLVFLFLMAVLFSDMLAIIAESFICVDVRVSEKNRRIGNLRQCCKGRGPFIAHHAVIGCCCFKSCRNRIS